MSDNMTLRDRIGVIIDNCPLLDSNESEREYLLEEIIEAIMEFLEESMDTTLPVTEMTKIDRQPELTPFPKEIFAHIASKPDKSAEVEEDENEGSGC